MAYAELQTTIAAFLNRSDLTAIIPTFIAMCEAELNRVLDTPDQVAFAAYNINSERVLKPDSFLAVKSFRLTEPVRFLNYIAPDVMDEYPARSGTPFAYTILGDSFTFWPAPTGDTAARLRYKTRIEALADSDTNWVLEKHYDAYLYGSLKHAAPYLVEDERVPVWQQFFASAIDQINTDAMRQNQGSALQTRSSNVPC